MKRLFAPALAALLLALTAAPLEAAQDKPVRGHAAPANSDARQGDHHAAQAQYVIAISVDGMGSVYVKPMLMDGSLANLKRLVHEGASTLNARTDAKYAVTLPDHTCMITGRPVKGKTGHHWTWNRDPKKGMTLASERGDYTASLFDVAHDRGLSTGLWSGKSKFSLYDKSYNANNGQPDKRGKDNGPDKIDYAMVKAHTMCKAITADFIKHMGQNHPRLSFVHFRDPDSAGHGHGWGTKTYRKALKDVDKSIGKIVSMVKNDPKLAGHTAIIITADHGGHARGHGDVTDLRDYMIPFLTWGAGVNKGDLYKLNAKTRKNPGTGMPGYQANPQPIRNGDLGNLALDLLGLPPIPGSTIDAKQNLKTQ